MSLQELYELFTESTKENFPEIRCIHKLGKDSFIRCSRLWYTCIIISAENKNEFIIKNLKPITQSYEDGRVLYGWIDENDCLYNNIENSDNLTDMKVIAFKENGYTLEHELKHELWSQ